MGYLVRRFLVEKEAFSEPDYLAEGMQEFYFSFLDWLATDEIDPWVREAAELITLQTAVDDNGFHSYLGLNLFIDRTYEWRPQAMQDVAAAYELIGGREQAKIITAISRRLEEVPRNDRRGVIGFMGYERAPEYPDLTPVKDWLDEQASELQRLDDRMGKPAHIIAERARREGLVKAVSESRLEKEVDSILAKSPTHRERQREHKEWRDKVQPYYRRLDDTVRELARMAGVDINFNGHSSGANQVAGAPGYSYHYKYRTPDDPPDTYPRTIAYFEDGDKGVLATYVDGRRLAEVRIEPGSTDTERFGLVQR